MMRCEVGFKFCGSVGMDGAEEEVGLGIDTVDTDETRETGAEALGFLEVGCRIGNDPLLMREQPFTCFNGKGID